MNKVSRQVDWIRGVSAVVIKDCYRQAAGRSQRSSSTATQRHSKSLVTFGVAVVDNRNREGLRSFARGKLNDSRRRLILTTFRSFPVNYLATGRARLVTRGIDH